MEVGFSLPSERVIRGLKLIIEWRGKSMRQRPRECQRQAVYLGGTEQYTHGMYPTGRAPTEWVCRTIYPDGSLGIAILVLLGRAG